MTHRHPPLASSFAIVAFAAGFGLAQTAEEQKGQRAYNTLAAPANLQLGTLPGISSLEETGSVGQVLLEGTTDEKTGTAAVGWKDGAGQFRLSAKAPLDKRSKEAGPLSLDGLSGDATVELSFSRFEFRGSPSPEIDVLHDLCRRATRARCEREPKLCPIDQSRWEEPCVPEKLPKDCENLCCEDLKKEDVRKKCKPELPPICGLQVCDYRNLRGPFKQEAAELLHLGDRIWFWGGSITAGRSTFDYLDAGSLESNSVLRTGWTVSGRIGVFSPAFGFLIGSFSHSKDFKAGGAAQQVCKPIPGTTATVCNEAILGAPTERKRSVISAEVRRFFANGGAVVPTVQYDLENQVTLVALPVYFLKNKDGAPTGGVRLAWRSDTDAATLSVFVGAALRLD